MSLRTDVTSAYDEVAPPVPLLRAQILAAVASENPAERWHGRHHRDGWQTGIRAVGSLVAALMIVLLVVMALVGARVWRDWSTFTTRPAPSPMIDQALLAQLEARPVHLPAVPAGAECPAGPYGSYMGFGDGPVSLLYGLGAGSAWGQYRYAGAATDWHLTGLILGRARDLNDGSPLVFVGQFAAGPIAGIDRLDGKLVQQHVELLMDANHPPQGTLDAGKHRLWAVDVGFATSQVSACAGFQFDGIDFSETFVIPPLSGP